ncbi:MAG: flagellin [Selenomonadaceae bacterium]|nr:flagellin [Selenomonadaceae bacterium]
MSMVVKHNIDALRVINLLDQNNSMLQKNLGKVASGMKINSAQDDSAPWAISERMRMRIRALEQDNQNIENDSALMKTAEGAVASTIELLKALKEKAINSANDSNTDEDRITIQKEVDQFIDQIDDNALVQFNGKYLIDGSKNNVVSSSKTILLNQSLATDTQVGSGLTALNNRVGDALEIQSTDKYTVSWVANGVTSTTSGTVGTEVALQSLLSFAGTFTQQTTADASAIGTDKFNMELYTPDKSSGIALVASTAGVTQQISGFTISITDSDGNVKKAANAALDQFKQYQRAENETGDKALTFHSGAEANVAIKVGLGDMRAEALGLKGPNNERLSVATKENANAAINVIENSLTKALNQQIDIGSVLSRLDYTKSNIITARDNDQESESVIRDADMAKEMTNYTKSNVLLQTAQAMLAQANQNSSAVLSLLR